MEAQISEKILKIIKYWLPALLWALVIFLFSANPTTRTSEIHWQDFIIKKSAHIFVFGVLALLSFRAFYNSNFSRKFSTRHSSVISVLYAISDEFHQSFTPGREPTLRDILIDTFAILVVLYLINNISRFPEWVKKFARYLELIK